MGFVQDTPAEPVWMWTLIQSMPDAGHTTEKLCEVKAHQVLADYEVAYGVIAQQGFPLPTLFNRQTDTYPWPTISCALLCRVALCLPSTQVP